MQVTVEVSPGELIDKITILEIKREKFTDAAKIRNVETELALLEPKGKALLAEAEDVARLWREVKGVNLELWEIEDRIREHEARQDFGSRFVELARAVYFTNDRRSAIKRAINEVLHSPLMEEKSYAPYSDQAHSNSGQGGATGGA
jgi:hypothetical protein